MIEHHLLALRARNDLGQDEERAIREAIGNPIDVKADTKLIRARQELKVSTLLLEGIACRYKDLRNGERQITALHIPGDFVDLHSFTLKRLDHDIATLTACRIATVPHEALHRITEVHPHLTRIYWFSTNLDAAMHREWELSLGRRTALARLAHLLCEMFIRFEIVGLTDGSTYPFNLTQADISECLGLTSVHVNRMLKQLREQQLATIRHGRVTILNWEQLQKVAEFDPAYLYLEKRPR